MNDIRKLISDYFDGPLSEEEEARLREYVGENPENAREFMRASLLHNCLHEYAIGAELREEAGGIADGHVLPRMQDGAKAVGCAKEAGPRSRWRYLAAAAILVPICAVSIWFVRAKTPLLSPRASELAINSHGGGSTLNSQAALEPVASVGRLIDAAWESGSPVPATGALLAVGEHELRAGYAQITFRSGASVVVRGPAKFVIESPLRMKLEVGELTTEVPAAARGFTVEVPAASVVDLGTEVGVAVNSANESHVEVFKGMARVQMQSSGDAAAAESRTLMPTMAVRVEGTRGVMEDASPEPLAFTRAGQLDALAPVAAAEVRWRGYAEELRRDPDLVAWYSFANLFSQADKLKNLATQTAGKFDGVLQNVTWEAGRFPDRPAMRFQGTGARGLVNISEPVNSLTFAAWVKIHSLDRTFISLLMSDGTRDRPDLCHIQFTNIADKPSVQISTPTPSSWDHYYFHAPDLGAGLDRWRFVAVVFDRKANTTSGYVDGVCVGTRPIGGTPPPLVFGSAEIGNWSHSRTEADRSFDGLMDDVALWKRAFKPEEIKQMYEAGAPAIEK